MENFEKIFLCPVRAYDCPYYTKDMRCHIGDPRVECDDYFTFMEDMPYEEDEEELE